MDWVTKQVQERDLAERSVLEIGSYDVNGSARSLFRGKYLGIDMRPGPGVDRVVNAHDLMFLTDRFGVVVCTEMLEHDETFWITLDGIERVLSRDGWLILTTRGIGFPQHDYPGDYYRFTQPAIKALIERIGLKVVDLVDDPQHSGVFALGHKP